MIDYVDYIGDNGACGRKLACASSVKHGFADSVAFYKHRVKNVVNARKRMIFGYYGGGDMSGYAAVGFFT
jgi:hypothetical protein